MDPRPELVNHYTSGSNIYEIPVFQRNYEWEEEKWFYLWNDIKELYNSAVYNMSKDSNLTIENALQNELINSCSHAITDRSQYRHRADNKQ